MELKELKTKVKVVLPPILDAHKAEELHKVMMDSLITQKPIEVSAGDIEKIDTLCAQILLATHIDCSSQNIQFDIKSPSKRMVKTLGFLGLQKHLLNENDISA